MAALQGIQSWIAALLDMIRSHGTKDRLIIHLGNLWFLSMISMLNFIIVYIEYFYHTVCRSVYSGFDIQKTAIIPPLSSFND